MPRNSENDLETYWSEFTYGGLRYVAFPQFGGFFGADGPPYLARPQLVMVPMLEDGSPDLTDGVPNVIDVVVVEADEQMFLAKMNSEFHTSFTIEDFPGR